MFSTTTEHALRALAQLAALPQESSVLGRDLAVATGIPANYLSKILLNLRNAGLIVAVRGSGGGYRLRRKPEEILLQEVVGLFDGQGAMTGCILGGGRECGEENPCTAHARWREVREAFAGFLASTSIAQISLHETRGTDRAGRGKGRGGRGGKQ